MNNSQNYDYEGEIQPPLDDQGQPQVVDAEGQPFFPYIPSEELKEAVNLAIDLEMPLLLEGEPGSGKTELARSIAYEFGQKYLEGEQWSYYPWYIKSDTRARDGLYTYDAIGRLRDAQLIGMASQQLQAYFDPQETETLIARLKDRKKYIVPESLGKALMSAEDRFLFGIEQSKKKDHPAILLIDEIDKADIDFPNDLLRELDRKSFTIPELNQNFRPTYPPIIIITSNREKPLSKAFLRRCIYFELQFPDEERLFEIVSQRFPQWEDEQQDVVEAAIDRFMEVREVVGERPGGKAPSTSEFLKFMKVLLNKPVSEAFTDIQELATRLPIVGILLKTSEDQTYFKDNDES
ncbi:MAG: AAA family ATPase [Halothece sp.]